jgi:hypothetical protein
MVLYGQALHKRRKSGQCGWMNETFLTRVWRYGFARTIRKTDAISMIVGLAVPAWYSVKGMPIPANAFGLAAILIFLFVGASICVRMLLSPYFIWREDQVRIATLEHELEEPKRISERHAAEHAAQARRQLADSLSRMKATLLSGNLRNSTEWVAPYLTAKGVAEVAIEVLSVNVAIRSQARDFVHLCDVIIDGTKLLEDTREPMAELNKTQASLFPLLVRH